MRDRFHAPCRFAVWFVLLTACLATTSIAAQQERPPDQNDLNKLFDAISKADRVAVFRVDEGTEAENLIYSSSKPKDLIAFRTAIRVEPPKEWFRCACTATTIIRLYKKGQALGSLEIYTGADVYFSAWQGDAMIANPEPWFNWLDQRSISWPRAEYNREMAGEKAEREAEERWVKTMPTSLVPLWPDSFQPDALMNYDLGPLDAALNREYPDKDTRIRSLLAWYGSGTGPWSGYPAYEEVAAKLLLEYSTSELLLAVQSSPMGEEQIEGAARLFAGWDFRHARPADNALLPVELKRLLLNHSLKSTDQDKLERARKAFAANPSPQSP
jgi:hypothetical protein